MINSVGSAVTDFGADPTGVADSTAAIQAALDAGGLVTFPSGTYKILSRLSVDIKQTSIRGLGSVVIDATAVTDPEAIRVYSTATYNEQQTLYNFQNVIEKISFLGDRQSNVAGISVGRLTATYAFSNDVTIRDCGFFDFDVGVVFTDNAWRTHFDKCGFFNIGVSFVNFPAAANAGECMTFTNCCFINGDEPSAGMSIENGQFHFHNCSFPGGGDTGVIDIFGAAHVVFDGWNFETQPQNTDHSLVQVRQSAKAVIQNSTIITNEDDYSEPYFVVQDAAQLTIKDCTIALYDTWATEANYNTKCVVTGGTRVFLENNNVYGTGLSTPITAWAIVAEAANMLYNGNAELNNTFNWTATPFGVGSNTFTNVTTNPKNGSRNYRIQVASTGGIEVVQKFTASDMIGRTVVMGFWAQATAGTGTLSAVQIQFFMEDGTLIDAYGAINITDANAASYTWFGQSTVVPKGTSYIGVYFSGNQVASGATIDIDDIVVNVI
jgi:hypothetical protein